MWTHSNKTGRRSISTVHVGIDSKKIVFIDPTHPFFISKRSKRLTYMLASVHRDLLQALFTKQHTKRKETHTNKDHNEHRVNNVSGRT